MVPRILAVASAVPEHRIDQARARELARAHFGALGGLVLLYDNAGVEARHCAVPPEWHAEPRGWRARSEAFMTAALALLERAARDCLARAGRAPETIDAVVTVCSTGVAIPSLDARLVGRLGLRRDVARLPLFGLGCAGGVLGLARAASLARDATVLLLVVELSSVNLRAGDLSMTNLVSAALFGDGAAAVLVGPGQGPAIAGWGEFLWPDSQDVMGFSVQDDGLGIVLRKDVPDFTRRNLRAATERFLAGRGLTLADIDGFICHPGGRKVLEAIQAALGLAPARLERARAVLREFGNMSAPTVLFVLERTLRDGARGRHLVVAFGPGFCVGYALLELA